MNLEVIQGGQTGVDRGAWRASVMACVKTSGYAPRNAFDERGAIPPQVMKSMRLAPRGGYEERTRLNVLSADLVFCVVPDPLNPWGTPGTRQTLRFARQANIVYRAVDDSLVWQREARALVAAWFVSRIDRRVADVRIMIAGPRASLWSDGESAAFKFVTDLAAYVTQL